jgi:putative tricarboxylic transport membrane protein
LAALGAFVIFGASQLPAIPGQDFGPGFFPMLLGIGLMLGGIAYALTSLWRPYAPVAIAEGEVDAFGTETDGPTQPYYAALAWLIIGLLSMIVLWERVGFIILLSVFLVVFLMLLRVAFWRAALLCVLLTIAVYLVFIRLLMVPLPAGLLAALGL